MNTVMSARVERDLHLDSGLSGADYEVLSNLSEQPGLEYRLKDLSLRLLWSASRLSHQLTRMESRGLVERREFEGDGRGAVVGLTSAGLTAIERAAPGHVHSVRSHFLDPLNQEQLRVLGDISELVLAGLKD